MNTSNQAQADSTASVAPLLSIGLPVFNGARHLREAIESLLAQDVVDFELIISDNASVDDTPRICVEYASRDPRVHYTRNEVNIGAAANFNRVFDLSSGDYFMWASHDDRWDPRFARRCIETLIENPAAVLCTSLVSLVGQDGDPRPEVYKSANTQGMSVEERVHDLVRRFPWYDMYSVMRPSALKMTRMYAPSYGGDVHLLLELSILGEFLRVPEALFTYRLPDSPKSAAHLIHEIRADSGTGEQEREPASFLARDLLQVVRNSNLDAQTVLNISEDFVRTLSREDSELGRAILAERGLPPKITIPQWTAENEIRDALESRPCSVTALGPQQQRPSWSMRDGVRLATARRLLLRLLQPFADRQHELDTQQSISIAALIDETNRLRKRVEELERRESA